MCGKWKAPWYCCLSFSTSKRTVQTWLPELHQYPWFYYYSQYLHMNCGAWEPGQKGWAVTVPLPEPTSQLVSAHHLIEKLYFSSFTHRLNSCSQTIDYPFTVVAVSPDTLRQSIPFHAICKIHLSAFSLIRHSSDCKSLLSKIKCLGFFLAMLHKKAV